MRFSSILKSGLIFSLISLALFAHYGGSEGYVPILYQVYPNYVWLIYYLIFTLSIIILIYSFYVDQYYLYSLLFLVFVQMIYLSLPLYQNYSLYGTGAADILFHLGWVKYIQINHKLPVDNFYPLIHLLVTNVHISSGIDINRVPIVLSGTFTPIFVIGIYLFARNFWCSRRFAIATTVACSPFLFSSFHHKISPSIVSVFLFPIVLFIIHNIVVSHWNNRFVIIFVLMSFAFTILHPTGILNIILFLASVCVYYVLIRDSNRFTTSLGLLAHSTILMIYWLITNPGTKRLPVRILVGVPGPTILSKSSQVAEKANPTFWEAMFSFVNLYGPLFAYFALATVAVVILRFRRDFFEGDILTFNYLVGVTLAAIVVTNDIIIASEIRAAKYIIVFSIILVGWLLADTDVSYGNSAVFVVLVLIITSSALVTGMNTYEPNEHMTYEEYSGTKWMFDHNPGYRMYSYGGSVKTEMYMLAGKQNGLMKSFEESNVVSRGLNINKTIERGYLITKERDIGVYTHIPKSRERLRAMAKYYTPKDVEGLEKNSRVDSIYDNGGFRIWNL